MSLGAVEYTGSPAANSVLTLGNNSTADGLLTLNGASISGVPNTLLSNTTTAATTLRIADNVSGTNQMGLRLGASGVVNVAANNTIDIRSAVAESGGSRGITKTGAGVLSLSGANTFSGGVTVANVGTATNTGALRVGAGASLGTGAVTAGRDANYGTSFTSGGNAFLFVNNSAADTVANDIAVSGGDGTTRFYNLMKASSGASDGSALTLSGTLSGGGANTVLQLDTNRQGDSTTTFTLSGDNTIAGRVRLNRGALVVANPNALGTADLFLQTNANTTAGNLRFSGVATLANNIVIGATANQGVSVTGADTVTLSGVLSRVGGGSIRKLGTGTLTLTGANTYNPTGATTVSDGTLAVAGSGRLSDAPFAGGLALTAATSRFDYASSTDQAIAGVISGSGRVTKSGGSTLTLTGANTYSGTTTVNGGTLLVNGDQSGATGAVTVGSGGTLGGTGTVGGGVAVDGGTLAAGTGAAGGEVDLAVRGDLALSGAGLTADLFGTTGTAGRVAVGGAFDVTGGPPAITLSGDQSLALGTRYSVTLATAAGGFRRNGGAVTEYLANADFTLSSARFAAFADPTLAVSGGNLVLSFTPVPEPAAVLAVAAAGLGLARLRGRRQA